MKIRPANGRGLTFGGFSLGVRAICGHGWKTARPLMPTSLNYFGTLRCPICSITIRRSRSTGISAERQALLRYCCTVMPVSCICCLCCLERSWTARSARRRVFGTRLQHAAHNGRSPESHWTAAVLFCSIMSVSCYFLACKSRKSVEADCIVKKRGNAEQF